MPSATPKQHWTEVVADKRARRDALFPKEYLIPDERLPPKDQKSVIDVPKTCGVLTDAEIEITETPGPVLVQKMVAGELKSVDVTRAFCKRATIAHQLTNCLTEILFDHALEAAAKADAHLASTSTPIGPLHGLPVSLKDNFNIAGVDTTVGFVAWIGDACKSDAEQGDGLRESEMTKIMRDSGAILFCKTNVPVAMMIAESHNNVWGYTCNPYNRALSSGGSSGGEGALLALKGSPLGVGTDIGGSIRIPAAFCGLYGLKPSYGRFATLGARSGMPGQEAVRSINGPMSSSLEAVKLWAKTVVDDKPWERDPGMIPIPWREVDVKGKKLSFGIILDDGIVAPTPPVQRALRDVKASLEKAGHEVIEWQAHDPQAGVSLLERFFVGDGGVKIASAIAQSGETWVQGLEAYEAAYESSKHIPRTVGDLWSLQAERTGYVKKSLDAWLDTKKLTSTGRPFDAVISPTTAYAACPQHTFSHVAYTCLWNITDQSAATFPVTYATAEDVAPADFAGRNDKERAIWDRYDAEEVAGAPVSLQLIGQRLEEEKVLALVQVIAEALKA